LQGGMPYGLGQDDDALGSSGGNLTAAHGYLSARSAGEKGGLRRHGEVSKRSALARPDPVSRILSRRQRRGNRHESSSRLDGFSRQADPTVLPMRRKLSRAGTFLTGPPLYSRNSTRGHRC